MGTIQLNVKMKHTVVALVISALVGLAVGQLQDESKPEQKVFAGYVTRTRFEVKTSTTLLSCVSTLAQQTQCSGRRKRSTFIFSENLSMDEPAKRVDLEASEGEHSIEKREAAVEPTM